MIKYSKVLYKYQFSYYKLQMFQVLRDKVSFPAFVCFSWVMHVSNNITFRKIILIMSNFSVKDQLNFK